MNERASEEKLEEIYSLRFSDVDAEEKDLIWREVTRFLQRFVRPDAVILDIACDRGDFIRNIAGGEKWATDLRDLGDELPTDIRFVKANGLELHRALPNGHFDVVFMSNYLEHLPTSSDVIEQFRGRTPLAQAGRTGDRAAAEHPARRRPVLGLHRPFRRADGSKSRRGGCARRISHGRR